ncbi:MAG: hypothetical protein FWC70_07595 [Defluviitaleaceae bacterium]|nr:hypothetical protein [Defluviitaleaceae bacterium]
MLCIGEEASYLEEADGADYEEEKHLNEKRGVPDYFTDTRKPHKGNKYRCTRCGQYKPKSDFYKDKRVPCGIRNKCKACYHKK